MPGLILLTSPCFIKSPACKFFTKYRDLLNTLLFFSASCLTKLAFPKESQASFVSLHSFCNSSGSSEKSLSGPLSLRLNVKCFSIKQAPWETAATATVVPRYDQIIL